MTGKGNVPEPRKIDRALWRDLAEDSERMMKEAEREIARQRKRIRQLRVAARIFRDNEASGLEFSGRKREPE
jgi:hypothetical protein